MFEVLLQLLVMVISIILSVFISYLYVLISDISIKDYKNRSVMGMFALLLLEMLLLYLLAVNKFNYAVYAYMVCWSLLWYVRNILLFSRKELCLYSNTRFESIKDLGYFQFLAKCHLVYGFRGC